MTETTGGVEGPARVLLVDPYMSRSDPMERKFIELYPSLGLLNLGAYLQQQGVEVSMVDLTFARDLAPLTRALRSVQPHLVGVHTKTLTFERSGQIARAAHAAGAITVAGGPDSATRIEAYLDAGFDVVVPGEGEATLLELARTLASGREVGTIPGVAVRRAGKVVRGPGRPFLRDLDVLPLPAWDLVDMDRYLGEWKKRTGERRAALLTSRGCPFDCSWCSKPTFGRTFRQQSPARVVEELVALKERYQVDYVRFCDDVFGVSRPWIDELIDRMAQADLGLQFECLARVDLLKPDLLHRLRRVGLARVYVGVGVRVPEDARPHEPRDEAHPGRADRARPSRGGDPPVLVPHARIPGRDPRGHRGDPPSLPTVLPGRYSVSIAVPIPGTRFHETVKDRLLGRRRPSTRGSGGRSLLYEAAYPQRLYRWQQARFELEAALGRARGRISPELATRVAHVADRFHERVARPLLVPKHPGRAR